MTKSRHTLDGKIINLRKGLAIYKTHASPYYFCRVWVPAKKKRVVKTTKMTTRAEAISVAEELFAAMGSRGNFQEVQQDRTFEHFADKLVILEKRLGESGKIHPRSWKNAVTYLRTPGWGTVHHFGPKDVQEITTRDYNVYIDAIQEHELSWSTINHITSYFRKVLGLAKREGVIDAVPMTPREKRKDNPRTFFRFAPLVSQDHDEWDKLKSEAKRLAAEKPTIRGVAITEELYDFMIFMVHSFLRPTESEVYALTHRDIAAAKNPKRLIITIRKGKTGHRVSNTMPVAVSVYERIKQRFPDHKIDDYIFLPEYPNRAHARRVMANQFNVLLERCGLKDDRNTPNQHTVYSLRHTAICMRLILSHGKVNIFNLAKNAGTSVDQIERFYAKNLPLSAEMARNLQSFGKA